MLDIAVIGGGIVGVATARALLQRARLDLVVLEAEPDLAAHQTGHNSGVIHSGLYYRPGSLKARTCAAGRLALERFCEERGLPWRRCGKLVVATRPEQEPALAELERRGAANGLDGLRRLDAAELAEHEPHVAGVAGLWVPQTGIVDYSAVTRALADDVVERGGELRTGARVAAVTAADGGFVLETAAGPVRARALIACAGLYADRLARRCGVDPGVRIVPFRGEYYDLRPEARHLVRGLVYPVPDPSFPFLGVHFTRRVDDTVEAGPNAVLALAREGYRRRDVSLRDLVETLGDPGFRRLARRYWRTGLAEQWRSLSKRAFVRSLQALVPAVSPADVTRGGAGVRAQALAPDGTLLDDFHLVEAERQLHVLNAPSPAATASLAIGDAVAERALSGFGLSSSPR